jgi:ribosomal protein S18 acetylase RimI-like enzyme
VIETRPIIESDIRNLADLFVSVFNDEPWNEDWKVSWAEERLTIIFKAYQFYGLMAEDDGVPIGALFSRLGSFKGQLELEILETYVAKSAQRKGVGKKLLDDLEIIATKDGISCFVLFTDKTTYAKDFYAKNGFQSHEQNLLMSYEFPSK